MSLLRDNQDSLERVPGWVRPLHQNDISSYLSEDGRTILPDLVVLLTRIVHSQVNRPLNYLTRLCDTQLDCDPGTSLAVAYHLLATRQWRIDMQVPINPHQPLVLLSTALNQEEE